MSQALKSVVELEKDLELAKHHNAARSFASSIDEAAVACASAEQAVRLLRDRIWIEWRCRWAGGRHW
jgi:hypothetical protein